MLDDFKNVDLTWSIINNFDPVVAKIVLPLARFSQITAARCG